MTHTVWLNNAQIVIFKVEKFELLRSGLFRYEIFENVKIKLSDEKFICRVGTKFNQKNYVPTLVIWMVNLKLTLVHFIFWILLFYSRYHIEPQTKLFVFLE